MIVSDRCCHDDYIDIPPGCAKTGDFKFINPVQDLENDLANTIADINVYYNYWQQHQNDDINYQIRLRNENIRRSFAALKSGRSLDYTNTECHVEFVNTVSGSHLGKFYIEFPTCYLVDSGNIIRSGNFSYGPHIIEGRYIVWHLSNGSSDARGELKAFAKIRPKAIECLVEADLKVLRAKLHKLGLPDDRARDPV
jgi:hypothetical protein